MSDCNVAVQSQGVQSQMSQPAHQATSVGGGRWYRFAGAGGDALALEPPVSGHCGTAWAGWLSGWDRVGTPPAGYSGHGRYPATSEGVVEMTACFTGGGGSECGYHVAGLGTVQCQGFLLWRLPYAPDCNSAYCTAPSHVSSSGNGFRGGGRRQLATISRSLESAPWSKTESLPLKTDDNANGPSEPDHESILQTVHFLVSSRATSHGSLVCHYCEQTFCAGVC